MRILWIAPEAPVAPLTGGRERAQQMLAYLAQRHEVHLLMRSAPHEVDPPCMASVTRMPYGRSGWLERLQAWWLIRQIKPDIVHRQDHTLPPTHYDSVLEFHDLPEDCVTLHPTVRHLVAVSQMDASRLTACFPDRPIAVVPNGVDLTYWETVRGIPDSQTLLFPAALHWPPNEAGALTLITTIMPQLPRVQLVVAGRMPSQRLQLAAEAAQNVVLVPNPPDMRPLFARAALIVVPTMASSGTRLKILQALAAGRPVLSTPAGAAGLELNDAVEICSLEEFAGTIQQMLANSILRKRRARNGRRVVQNYRWERVLRALDMIYPS